MGSRHNTPFSIAGKHDLYLCGLKIKTLLAKVFAWRKILARSLVHICSFFSHSPICHPQCAPCHHNLSKVEQCNLSEAQKLGPALDLKCFLKVGQRHEVFKACFCAQNRWVQGTIQALRQCSNMSVYIAVWCTRTWPTCVSECGNCNCSPTSSLSCGKAHGNMCGSLKQLVAKSVSVKQCMWQSVWHYECQFQQLQSVSLKQLSECGGCVRADPCMGGIGWEGWH